MNTPPPSGPELVGSGGGRSLRRAFLYTWRAILLRCPECGRSPIFIRLASVRSLHDWFTPLDGCPRCGYAYERETGYFLLAIWAVNYGAGSLLGIAIYIFLESFVPLSLPALMAWVIGPIVVFNLLFARHSKSLFLAMDHFFDPHTRGGRGGDGGSKVRPQPPTKPTTPAGKPEPAIH